MQIVVEIEPEQGTSTYLARLRCNSEAPFEIRGVALGPEAKLPLFTETLALSQLLLKLFPESVASATIDFAFFSDPVQARIGRYLFGEVLGRLPPGLLARLLEDASTERHLRIVTNDPFLIRLPWVLLASQEQVFAKERNWSISLARELRVTDEEMAPLPRVLLAMPEPPGWIATEAKVHEATLKLRFSERAHERYATSRYWRVVQTWEQFSAALDQGSFDVIYFYGHGEGRIDSSSLIFESEEPDRRAKPVSMAQVALKLRDLKPPRPQVVYLNCCSGDAGGFLGAGMQLRSLVPAVFANRTFVEISSARRCGEIFFTELLLEQKPPHLVYNEICRDLALPGPLGNPWRSMSWMMLVLHASYRDWVSPKVRNRDRLRPNLELFDRTPQRQAIRDWEVTRPAAGLGNAVLWYGGSGQGIHLFHRHLLHDLRLALKAVHELQEFSWPRDLAGGLESDSGDPKARKSLVKSLCDTFDVAELEDLSQSLRHQFALGRGVDAAFYLAVSYPGPDAEQLPPDKVLQLIRHFLHVFDEEVAPHFERARFVPFVGFAIETTDLAAFDQIVLRRMEDLRLDRIRLMPTPLPLKNVEPKPISSQLEQGPYTRKLLDSERDEATRVILGETAGRYDEVVKFLSDEDRLFSLTMRVWGSRPDA